MTKTFFEKIPTTLLDTILSNGVSEPALEYYLDTMKTSMRKDTLHVQYNLSTSAKTSKRTYGREIANKQGFQRLNKHVRRLFAHENYIEIDMKNCHPVLLRHTAKQYGLGSDLLDRYADDREGVLKEVGGDRDELKQRFISLIYGGHTNKQDHPILKQFSKDVLYFRNQLVGKDDFKEEVKHGRKEYELNPLEWKDERNTMMSLILQRKESNILKTMCKYLEDNGFTVGAKIFDGLLLEKNDDWNDEHLETMTSSIKKLYGIDMKIIEKPLEPPSPDHPIFDIINISEEDALVSFHDEESAENKLIKTLCKKGRELELIRMNGNVLESQYFIDNLGQEQKLHGVYKTLCKSSKFMNDTLGANPLYHTKASYSTTLLNWLNNSHSPVFPLITYESIDPNIIAFPVGFFLLDELVMISYDDYLEKYNREPYTYHYYDDNPNHGEKTGTAPTPIWDKILSYQLSKEAQASLEILVGRLFYSIGQYDDFQVFPFIRGIANTGKSVIVDYICEHLLPRQEVGKICANIQDKFGLEGLYQKRIVAMTETFKKMNRALPKSIFQDIISGGIVTVNLKNAGSVEHTFIAHLLAAGNCNFDYEDDSGSIARRTSMFSFNNTIPSEDRQTDLKYKMEKERLSILFKCILSYRKFASANIGKDWWSICSQEEKDNRESISIEQNYLADFLSNGNDYYEVIYKKGSSTPFDKIQSAYRRHMKFDLGINSRVCITTSDYSPFQERGYKIEQMNMCKSCNKKAVGGKEKCCDDYHTNNRIKKKTIWNMELHEKNNQTLPKGVCLVETETYEEKEIVDAYVELMSKKNIM